MKKFLICNLLFVIACSPKEQKPSVDQIEAHKKEVESWFDNRVEELKSHNGWLNLAGLFWMKEGMNSFGSDATTDLVFPEGKIAGKAGYLMVKGQTVTLTPLEGSDISIYGAPVTKETVVFHPDSANAVKMLQGSLINHGSLAWYVIRREEKMGIRLRDLESEGLKNFKGIERYPVDYSWRVPARFERAAAGETIAITNVLGQTMNEELTGKYFFEIDGKEYSLSATGKGKELFVVFADATTGKETYDAGRFIYIDQPDSTGHAFIDFNKSYNPPCAFTEFATCPLPPKQNVLPVSILAGEKNYDLHGKQASPTL